MIEMFQQRQWELEHADLGRIPRAYEDGLLEEMFRPQKRNFPTESVKTMHRSEDHFAKSVKFLRGYRLVSRSSGAMARGLRA